MQKKKPDIFLGITMGMLVLAAVLCLVILIAQKSAKSKTNTNPAASGSEVIGSDVVNPSNNTPDASNPEGSEPNASDSGPVNPDPGPVDVSAIDEVGLKAALDDCLSGLPNDWQVVVIDPIVGTEVDSQINAGGVDEWMKADGMPVVFIMGAAFQKVADGELTEDQILEDCTLMIVNNDAAAGDRLTKLVGGMDAVKSFATANDLKLGYNRTLVGSGSKPNYVTALQMSKILNKICRGELVSKEASDKMLDILCTKKDSEVIDLGITDENISYGFVSYAKDKVSVATMGIVRLPHRSFVISVICNGPNSLSRAKDKVTQLVGLTIPYFAD